MRGSPEYRDKTCEIARGPFFHAEVSRRFGPILAAPGALRENPRGKCSYNHVAPRPALRNGSQLCYQQHKGLFIYKLVWLCPCLRRSSPCDARLGSTPQAFQAKAAIQWKMKGNIWSASQLCAGMSRIGFSASFGVSRWSNQKLQAVLEHNKNQT